MGFTSFFKKKHWEKKKGIFPIFVLAIFDFIEDNAMEKGATLTFYSLLSIIPIVAVGFGIAQYFGLDEKFTAEVKNYLSSQPEIADKIVEFANSTLKQTKGGIIAGLGLIVLFWTVFRMIGNIANFFNQIWGVKTSRSLWQQFKYYVPLILLFPLFLVGSSNLILYAIGKALFLARQTSLVQIDSYIYRLFDFIPFFFLWLLLSFLYIYLPNTKVYWKAGIIGGVFAALFFQIWQWIYINFQVKSASYGAIYGSFAAIPLFLIWLYYSWLIVIFGIELAYHIQRRMTHK